MESTLTQKPDGFPCCNVQHCGPRFVNQED